LVPGTGKDDLPAYQSNRSRLYSLLVPVWKPLFQALLSAILYTLLGLSSSIYLGKLTDHVFVTHNVGLLNLMENKTAHFKNLELHQLAEINGGGFAYDVGRLLRFISIVGIGQNPILNAKAIGDWIVNDAANAYSS